MFPYESRTENVMIKALVILFVITALVSLVEPTYSLWFRVLRDYNEGWNAYWADTAVGGGRLYPPFTSRITNNYPPLSFYIYGYLGKLIGDRIIAGRLISLIGFLIVACNIGLWLRLIGVSGVAAIVPSLTFIATMYSLAPHIIGMYDPQLLAHAFMTTALIIIWKNPERIINVLLGLCFMIAGGWIKHLLLPLPIVVTLWFAKRSRKIFFIWIIGSILTIIITFVIAYILFGFDFLNGLLFSPHQYSLRYGMRLNFSSLMQLFPIVMLVPAIVMLSEKSAHIKFIIVYLIVSGVIAILAGGALGMDKNNMFDFAIAGSMAMGIVIDRAFAMKVPIRRLNIRPGIGVLALVLVMTVTVLCVRLKRDHTVEKLETLKSRENTTMEDVRIIQNSGISGAVCESLALCYWAGAPFHIDFWNYSEKLKTGKLPLNEGVKTFSEKPYSIIQLEAAKPPYSWRLPKSCNEAILEHYTLVRTSLNGGFFIPKNVKNLVTTPIK